MVCVSLVLQRKKKKKGERESMLLTLSFSRFLFLGEKKQPPFKKKISLL